MRGKLRALSCYCLRLFVLLPLLALALALAVCPVVAQTASIDITAFTIQQGVAPNPPPPYQNFDGSVEAPLEWDALTYQWQLTVPPAAAGVLYYVIYAIDIDVVIHDVLSSLLDLSYNKCLVINTDYRLFYPAGSWVTNGTLAGRPARTVREYCAPSPDSVPITGLAYYCISYQYTFSCWLYRQDPTPLGDPELPPPPPPAPVVVDTDQRISPTYWRDRVYLPFPNMWWTDKPR